MPREIPTVVPDNPALERALDKSGAGVDKKAVDAGPIYRVLPGSKIPVSKHAGALWASRKSQGLSARANSENCWNEAIRYYENDQTSTRTARSNTAGNQVFTGALGSQWSETENVVFANCSTMVPMLYAKNPTIATTSENDALTDLCKAVTKLGNKLMSMKSAPGLNFKVKARRMVLTCLLTNAAYVKIGWTQKEDSSAAALTELERLAQALATATSRKQIMQLEGEVMALEEKVSLLSPSGPWCRNLTPDRIVRDPTALNPDLSEDNWVMEWDMLPTSYINAVYASKEQDEYKSVYEPTHVLNRGTTTGTDGGQNIDGPLDEVVNNFVAIQSNPGLEAGAYGYNNLAAFKSAQYTKIWYVWDKVTRRVYMYADNAWKWPIWVWDDPLKLPRFFPYFMLWFHESTNTNAPKGEVTYYLDQQDAINEISSEERQARAWARRNIFYNKNKIGQEDVEKVMTGPDGTARGVDVPEDGKLSDVIFSFPTPATKFPELFNKESKFAAINRLTGISDAMRGAQFKTNTTNKAIDFYNSAVEVRSDEKIDLIEDVIADIMWNVTMLCLMNWEQEDVAPLIGEECAGYWQKVLDNRMFDTMLNMRVEGGSTGKPNSREMKQQTIQLGQALGQFANAAPAAVLVILKMFERSFPEFVIEDREWELIEQTMMQSLMKAGAGPGGADQQGGTPPPANGAQGGQADQQVRQRIEALSPEAKAQLEKMVQAGMPPSEALQKIEAATNTQQ